MTTDHFIDRSAISLTSDRLRAIREWAAEALDDAICRITETGRTAVGGGDRPLEFNATASDVAHEALGTLRVWAEHICQHSAVKWPGEQRIAEWARWLDRHLIDLAKTEEAPQAVDEIGDVHRRIMRVIDLPPVPEFVGPCQAPKEGSARCGGVYCAKGRETLHCRTCDVDIDIPTVRAATEAMMSVRRFTKAELRVALLQFTDRPVSRHVIDGWIRHKRITDDGAGRYKLADALALLAERKPA
ncbi:hypothetical protein WKY82_10480 [Gordonia malaquae]|uniref:hypothetical protein n=1 Tax=Gordonia malaquae TaxID=410332 RepID=UPI0030C79A98